MPNTKPLVIAAVVCEKVIIETDNVPSLMRVVDRLEYAPPPIQPVEIVGRVKVILFFAVRAGDLTTSEEFTVRTVRPNQATQDFDKKWTVEFGGAETGGNLRLETYLVAEPGVFYFQLLWRGEVLASTPFRLGRAPESPQTELPMKK
jgi:hypothetical protein